MVDDTETAADIVQEVFTGLYVGLHAEKTVFYINTWLYRATINQCLNVLNKVVRHQGLETLTESPSEETTPEIEEQNQLVRQALNRMKPKERVLLVMYSEGCSYREIADATGIRFASVGKTLSRALEKMEKQLITIGYEMP